MDSLDPGNSIVVSSSFSHMLNLGNLAEEVQIAHRRRLKTKSGDIGDENCALTESDIDETFRRLVYELHKSPKEIYDALKCQTVDLVLTAHPTQSVRRSLLQKHGRYANEALPPICLCLAYTQFCHSTALKFESHSLPLSFSLSLLDNFSTGMPYLHSVSTFDHFIPVC